MTRDVTRTPHHLGFLDAVTRRECVLVCRVTPHVEEMADALDSFVALSQLLNRLPPHLRLGTVLNARYVDWSEEEGAGTDARDGALTRAATRAAPQSRDDAADTLGCALAALRADAAFACYGFFKAPTTVLRVRGKDYDVDARGLEDEDVAEIEAACVPAPYGDLRTQTTVLDPSVRAALECAAPLADLCDVNEDGNEDGDEDSNEDGDEDGDEDETDETDATATTAATVTAALVPVQAAIERALTGCAVRLVPYKLNVYQAGGFFARHVDTPLEAGMLGSLVVGVPTKRGFRGGELLLHEGTGRGFAMRTPATDGDDGVRVLHVPPADAEARRTDAYAFDAFEGFGRADTGGIPWVAFWGDVPHEVSPVTEGVRITFTYAIMRAASDARAALETAPPLLGGAIVNSPDSDALLGVARTTAAVRAALVQTASAAVLEFARRFGPLGIVLSRRYGHTTTLTPSGLKGADAALYEALAAVGSERLDLQLQPVAVRTTTLYPREGFDSDTTSDVYSLSPADVACLRASAATSAAAPVSSPVSSPASSADEDEEDKDGDGPSATKRKRIETRPFVQFDSGVSTDDAAKARGVPVRTEHTDDVDFTGNSAQQGSDETLYLSVALLVTPAV